MDSCCFYIFVCFSEREHGVCFRGFAVPDLEGIKEDNGKRQELIGHLEKTERDRLISRAV